MSGPGIENRQTPAACKLFKCYFTLSLPQSAMLYCPWCIYFNSIPSDFFILILYTLGYEINCMHLVMAYSTYSVWTVYLHGFCNLHSFWLLKRHWHKVNQIIKKLVIKFPTVDRGGGDRKAAPLQCVIFLFQGFKKEAYFSAFRVKKKYFSASFKL